MKTLLTAVLLLASAAPALACRCAPAGATFDETVKNSPGVLVVYVEVNEVLTPAARRGRLQQVMKAFVLKKVQGGDPNATIEQTLIEVTGSDGANCGETLERFEAGKRYALALRSTPGKLYYHLSNCGVFFRPLKP